MDSNYPSLLLDSLILTVQPIWQNPEPYVGFGTCLLLIYTSMNLTRRALIGRLTQDVDAKEVESTPVNQSPIISRRKDS